MIQTIQQNNTTVAVKEKGQEPKQEHELHIPQKKKLEVLLPLGLIGLEDYKEFTLECESENPVVLLQSVKKPELVFYLISPHQVCKEYRLTLMPYDYEVLKTTDLEKVLVFAILTLNEQVERITCNLLGPLLINTENNVGKQCINNGWSTKHRLSDGQPLSTQEKE